MDGFDDEEIARAIALSLQETSQVPAKSKAVEVIEIQDDSDDEVSPSHSKAATEVEVSGMRPSTSTSCAKSTSSSTREVPLTRPGGAFLFDRAQLERERLARQKRLRPDIVHNRGNEDEEDEEVEEQPNAKSTRSVASTSVNTNLIAQTGSAAGRSESLFWEGELRQTANKHVDLDKDVRPVFRLTEILAPRDEIEFAIVSAYVINFPWLYALFNPRTPVIAVTHDPQGNETIKEVLPEWIKTTPFLRGGRGCMHMKFMLLFYKSGRLRIVVSTANLLEIDWRDIENSVWVQDVSLRSTPIPHDSEAADFPSAFTRVLRAVNVAPALLTLSKNGHENLPLRRLEDLRSKWDFSKLKAQLVPSLAGKHEGWHQVLQTGHTALMKAVRDLRVRTTKGNELVLECQGSSIGTYTTQWTNEFYCSARGDSAEQWLDKSRASRSKLDYPPLKILFPSGRTVRESVLGEPGGGTMFCRRNQWEAAKFPRHLFHDSKSKRGKVLVHSKMIVGTFLQSAFGHAQDSGSETEPEDDEVVEVAPKNSDVIGWAYVGSHNFTPSAWGTLSGSGFNPVLNVTNYELGVVFPLRDEKELETVACWERPPKKYGREEPWFQNESPFFSE